ncbi:MAG: TM2 domain-containing protein [Hydrococcus sp. Prado102]|jgi:TM2 domain-containing membrane protein YozV|nr:TM2 domain-containing protein [Hydrococcus sp. Prado102]
MNIDSAKKKLADGRLSLAKAGDDPDLLGVALTKIHAALEDACRTWLSDSTIVQSQRFNSQNRAQVSWKELLALMSRYYQWSDRDVEYVRRMNSLRNQTAHGEEFQGKRQDVENYASYVENLFEKQKQPTLETPAAARSWNVAPLEQKTEPANLWLAYALWGLGLFGMNGIHRFYLGRPVTGAVWLFSYGCLFIGQLLDLFLIPGMAKGDTSEFWRSLRNNQSLPRNAIDILQKIFARLDSFDRNVPKNLLRDKPDSNAMHKLLNVAAANGKVLSMGQAVLATGFPPNEVEDLLNEALRRGLAHVGNDPESGAVRYYFDI